jgi:hypothetical protein
MLCRDNNYVQNLANADEETKKHFQRIKKHLSDQYAMSTTSYKPNNQEASNNINIVRFTPEQQWHKTPDQLYLHLCDFMMEGIGTITKTANNKKPTKRELSGSSPQLRVWLVVQFGDTVIVLRGGEFWLKNAIGLYLSSNGLTCVCLLHQYYQYSIALYRVHSRFHLEGLNDLNDSNPK